MKILVFTEGTVLMPFSGKDLTRVERVGQSKRKERAVGDYRSYIPTGKAVEKLWNWKRQGADIYYLTSRTTSEQINDIERVLLRFNFPDNQNLLYRRGGEEYHDVAEKLIPDVLVEDDCESIGGEAEMTSYHIKTNLKQKIRSIVVKEFGGIDFLPDEVIKLKRGGSFGRELHVKAEKTREQDDHWGALKLLDEAITEYQKEGNFTGVVLALQSRFLTYKHLFSLTKDEGFAKKGQKEAEAGFEIAIKQNLSGVTGSCYFRLGEAAMLFGDYSKAVFNYKKALENFSGIASEKGDYRYHLGEALYRSGKKEEGERVVLLGLEEIKSGAKGADSFLIHVWESGCYVKLAELLREDKLLKAKEYLGMASEIIKQDKRLVIRKRQLKELLKLF